MLSTIESVELFLCFELDFYVVAQETKAFAIWSIKKK